MNKKLQRLAELAAKLPKGLSSDWEDTNHYELTSPYGADYFWLMVGEGLGETEDCNTECGKRFGLIMDIAEEVARLRDTGFLTSSAPSNAPPAAAAEPAAEQTPAPPQG